MNKNIESQLKTIETVLEATAVVISQMNDGDRMQVKKLAEQVGVAVGMEPKHVLGFVNHFAHNTDIAYVTRGKNGGIVKGVKVIKPAKVSKRVKTTAVVATVVADAVVSDNS